MAHATHIANVGNYTIGGWRGWYWLSDRELFVAREGRLSVAPWRFDRHDVATGLETPEDALNAALVRGTAGGLTGTAAFVGTLPYGALSPDRGWILWQDTSLPHAYGGRYRGHCAPVGGDYVVHFADSRLGSDLVTAWLPDSSGWAEFRFDPASMTYTSVRLYRLRDRRPLPKPAGQMHVEPYRTVSVRTLGITGTTPVLAPDGHAITADLRGSDRTHRLDLTELDLNAPRVVHRRSLPLPPGGRLLAVELHPDRDCIVYTLHFHRGPRGPAVVRRLLSLLGDGPRDERGVWLSRMDGSDLREVGHVTAAPGARIPYPGLFTLLPGGRKLSFFYRGSLYVALAE